MSFPASATERLAATAAELVASASLEMGAHRPEDARRIAAILPAGTTVYVNHLPRHRLADSLASLAAVRAAGLEPVPHLAARRIASRAELARFLAEAVREAGVRKALLVGGDDATTAGPYGDALALLAEGNLAQAGLREVGFAAYPEGHPRLPRARIEEALDAKLAAARAQGLSAWIVTQFSFAPTRVVEYLSELARRHPDVPAYVGLAGPTDPQALLRFAQRCGVSASLRALRAQGFGAVRLVTHTDPGEQLRAVARYCAAHPACNVVAVHVFTFGGVEAAARWLVQQLGGAAGA